MITVLSTNEILGSLHFVNYSPNFFILFFCLSLPIISLTNNWKCFNREKNLAGENQLNVLFLIVIKANGVVIFMNVDNIFVSIYLFFYRVLIYGSHAILINLCKNENGKIPFSSASVVLLSEVMKVLNCMELYVTVEEAFFFSILFMNVCHVHC